jgi:L-amino acid N-acyltransferase YncA
MDERVLIRKAEPADVRAITEIYNEAILTTTATFDTEEKSVEDRLKWFRAHDEAHPVLVGVLGAKVVGWASLSAWSDRAAYAAAAETSIYVASECRGKGIGRILYKDLVEEARRLQYHTLVARIADGSVQSLRLHEGTGFVHAGVLREVGRKFGKLIDVHFYQKILE